MPTKLLMYWDVKSESASEYYEFLVHEFIPGMNKLGIDDISVWFTVYGSCEQKMASGITQSIDQMQDALNSETWMQLINKLEGFVDNFSQKVVPATRGFQI